jgi:hypothetical protein
MIVDSLFRRFKNYFFYHLITTYLLINLIVYYYYDYFLFYMEGRALLLSLSVVCGSNAQ